MLALFFPVLTLALFSILSLFSLVVAFSLLALRPILLAVGVFYFVSIFVVITLLLAFLFAFFFALVLSFGSSSLVRWNILAFLWVVKLVDSALKVIVSYRIGASERAIMLLVLAFADLPLPKP